MVEFLTTSGINFRLEEIIKGADEQLIIISPFLKINDRIKKMLEEKDRFKIDIRVIYGKTDLRPDQTQWLESMASIRTSFRRNLHAKCYLNEKEALLTSMNLYEFSQVNNDEMGLLVSKEIEPDLYNKILEESRQIIRRSEEVRLTVSTVNPAEEAPHPPIPQREGATAVDKPQSGYCIRCNAAIAANPVQPYCRDCFRSWNRYKNLDYEEKDGHCHICGGDHVASMNKPLCRPCYRKYRDMFEFTVA